MTQNAIAVEPDQAWTVDGFRPEDAPGVVALFKSVYGEGYPVAAYLDPDLLIKENREGRVTSSVARIPSGAIVGHASLFNSAPNPRVFESGAGLVHKLYRGGHGISTQIFYHCIETGRKSPDVDLIFGEPVCNHPYSQKVLIRKDFVSCAMEVDLMPAQAYAKEESSGGRVSTLLGFLPLKPLTATVYVPQIYRDQFSFCYTGLDAKRTFEAAQGTPKSPESTMKVQQFDFAGVARVAVSDAGQEFEARMREEETGLLDQGFRVIQVWLNTGQPWVGTAASALRSMGYFFGGVLPCWFGSDGLLMQKVLDTPDWENTVLEGDRNQALGAMVKSEWSALG
jgi:hypothetical protein